MEQEPGGGTRRRPPGPHRRRPDPVYIYRRIAVLSVPLAVIVVVVVFLLTRGGGSGNGSASRLVGSRSTTSTARGAASPTPGTSTPGSATPTTTPTSSSAGSAPCTVGAAVLTVRASERTYPAGVAPVFTAALVSASGTGCVVTGPVVLTVTSGHDRVWSNADCTPVSAATVTRLGPDTGTAAARSGASRVFTWNGRRSQPGCVPFRAAVATPGAGTYRVRASWGPFTSTEAVFALS